MICVDEFCLWVLTLFREMLLNSSCWFREVVAPDIKSIKIFCFGVPFFIVIFVALVTYLLAWHPAAVWHHKYRKDNQEAERSVNLVLNDSAVATAGPVEGMRRIPVNFLPDTSDIEILEGTSGTSIIPEIYPKNRIVYEENEPEALVALRKGIQMKRMRKFEKAQKLFQHALSLCPSHPDILNCYGEFLEEEEKDVVKADHLYQRALAICPQHSKAIMNSKRTLPVVEEIDEKQLSRIDLKRMRLIEVPPNEPSFKRMKKEAYFQHIHHTVAIEGNTMTLAETRVIVETGMAIPGKSILEHNEIIGLEAALRFINNSLVSKIGQLTIEDILNIHKRVLGNVDPIQAGSFRKTQVYVGEHTPPAASDVYNLMEDFIDWLNSEPVVKMHPVKQAALAHYKLVFIHPFVDGNGRTARLLMNLILMREGYPPVIIRKQDRALYYKYLQVANEGDVRPFVRFIAQSTEGTLDVYLYATEYGVPEVKALEAQKSEIAEIIEV